MIQQLELDWLGGAAERRFRRRRPGIDDLPWGTLTEGDSLPWTDGAFREYASAAAFTALATALLEAGAPIDLTAIAADFAVDEMVHVELNARVAAELGGAAPYHVELEKVSPYVDPALPAIERAVELALTLSCIGEALSVPALVRGVRDTSHPLIRAVLARIVADERPHAEIGWLVLDWAGERVDRARLAQVGRARLEAYRPLIDDHLRHVIREAILPPLEARGIVIDAGSALA